jgi:NAD(P)H-dependent FMN reductase
MPKVMIIVASTRPGRVGIPMAEWIRDVTLRHGGFESVDFADLAEIDLPFMNEPHHPRLHKYTHQHTRDWSARVAPADAFVVVTPEYNYGMTAPLKNAIDYLHREWAYKPVAFVSYGGVAAGTRSVQMTKLVMTTLRMFALFEAVYVPFVHQFIGADGRVQPNEVMEKAAVAMLDELVRVAVALRPLREER